MEVKIKDRDESVEYLRMALAMCEFGVSYKQALLIASVSKKAEIMGGDFSLKDAAKLFCDWKRWCEDYDREAEEKSSKNEQP